MPRKKKAVELDPPVVEGVIEKSSLELFPEVKNKILESISSKWLKKECEICSFSTWEMNDQLACIQNHNQTFCPMVVVYCKNCANTKMFGYLLIFDGLSKK